MITIKSIYTKIVTNQAIMRVFHTFWQSFLAVLLVGILPVFNSVVSGKYSDAKAAGVALAIAAVAAGISAVKNAIVYRGK